MSLAGHLGLGAKNDLVLGVDGARELANGIPNASYYEFNDDLCRTIIEYMLDSEGPFAITRYKKFGSPWFYQAS